MNQIDKPVIITDLENRLNALICKDDKPTISVDDVASFLEIDREKLVSAALLGTLPFGFGCPASTSYGNRYARISKLTFWHWIMGK